VRLRWRLQTRPGTLPDASAPISGYLPGRWFTSGQAELVGSKQGSRLFGENRTNALANDRIFTGLQHPYPTTSVFASAGIPWLGFCPGFGFSSIEGFPLRKASTIWSVVTPGDLRVEAYEEMWNLVGVFGPTASV
jgi:hypothetical protein